MKKEKLGGEERKGTAGDTTRVPCVIRVCGICGPTCHTSQDSAVKYRLPPGRRCVCVCLWSCDEIRGDGGLFYYFITPSAHMHTKGAQHGHLNNSVLSAPRPHRLTDCGSAELTTQHTHIRTHTYARTHTHTHTHTHLVFLLP